MLAGLNVPSLECKYVFHRPEHNASRNPMKWNFKGQKF